MQQLGLNEIREKFLNFFESKQHLRMDSFPLIPQNDKSLLLINSGMAPLKPYFTGEQVPPNVRVTTCQKCIRTPDIERVGKTARHGTFFEMLGNFSFGDYFKNEIIPWSWEFCTEVMQMPADKLWVTVYLDDDEALAIWRDKVGVPAERIVKMGKEDNFWEIGQGPCGPCSEIYFDRGVENACSPDCVIGCDCDRYVEFWNLVFTQFYNDGKNNYTPLKQKNIDTGMGLERLACIMQGVGNLFEVDTIKNIMNKVCEMANVEYKASEKTDVSLRVITDHVRSTVFMVCDGVLPSNEGRGYVLRKLLRRAARHGKLLGIKGSFLSELCNTVIEESKGAYPELFDRRDYIKKVISIEEEKFALTIDSGLTILNDYIKESSEVLDGAKAFKLYDTYGFPLDLTLEIAAESGLKVDEKEFMHHMEEQKNNSRKARESQSEVSWSENSNIDLSSFDKTEFVGYTLNECETEILALIANDESAVQCNDGEKVAVILKQTPFYGEGGGQIGDKGEIIAKDGKIIISTTTKTPEGIFIHSGNVIGTVKAGEKISAKIDVKNRADIMRNHSATHLLQKALRTVLGTHAEQAGSYVTPKILRFDFTHFAAMTKEELAQVENIVNESILSAYCVNIAEMTIKEAKEKGAMALFGEKYGSTVRVVEMGDFSVELCGGTHISNTAQIGLFKIISEASVGAGVRRIEATTGRGVMELLNNAEKTLENAATALKAINTLELVNRCNSIMAEIKDKNAEIEELNQKIADSRIDGMFEDMKNVNGVNILSATFSGTKPDTIRAIGDKIREKAPKAVAIIVGTFEGKSNMLCVCGDKAIEMGAHAGKIVKEVSAIAGGNGGGKATSAMAGIGDQTKIDEAVLQLEAIVAKYIK